VAVVLLLSPAQAGAGSIGDPLDMLGISGMSCSCSQTIGEGENYWSFQSEPEIERVRKGGPAEGKLKAGDTIVALNGFLITTRKAGVLFANLEPGEPVTLTISRRGENREVTIVPVDSGKSSLISIPGFDTSGTWSIPELSRSIEDLALSLENLHVPDLPDFPDFPDFDSNFDFSFADVQPRGWFGFGLSMSGSVKQEDDEDVARWRFDSPPTIKSVEPDSPADRAGFKEGDKLTQIDGVRIDSNKGGRRFSEVEPGDVVTWTYKRDGKSIDVEMTAEERPESAENRTSYRSIRTESAQKSLYSENYGDTRVNVVGTKRMKVYTDPETGELVIETRDGTVRLQKTDKNG
jgi:membrane-associated protease RseP (regulator of RpoE activity)